MVTLRISITEITEDMGLLSRPINFSPSLHYSCFATTFFLHVGRLAAGDDQGQDVFDVYGVFGSSISLRFIRSTLLRPPFMQGSFLCVFRSFDCAHQNCCLRRSSILQGCWSI